MLLLDPDGIEADEEAGRHTVALPDGQSLQAYFDGSALQAILATLNDLRTVARTRRS